MINDAEQLGHVLLEAEDFSDGQYDDATYKYVVDGGLGICKLCGKAEAELFDGPCEPKTGSES